MQGPVWSLIESFAKETPYLKVQRAVVESEIFQRKIHDAIPELVVMHGPLKGMRYPTAESHGSALWPKLLGTYEKELHHDLDRLLNRTYHTIFDWGTAEGYYLVGLGMRQDQAKLIGIDPDPRARKLCENMAQENGLNTGRIQIFESGSLSEFQGYFQKPVLIISDCEGYESVLFDRDLHLLENADLLIECHDFVVSGITAKLCDTIGRTHTITVRSTTPRTIDDLSPPTRHQLSSVFTVQEIEQLISEGRPGPMQWIIAEHRPTETNQPPRE